MGVSCERQGCGVRDELVVNPERREGVEFRIAGRTLSGVVLRYGDVSPDYRERFLPGSLSPVPTVQLNIQHDRNMKVLDAGAFILTDTDRELRIRAELPEGSAALSLVRRGALNGYSVEFNARSERREAGVRVIERAELVGVGLVDKPSYPDSLAEVRARGDRGGRLFTARGRVAAGKRLDCRCSPGDCTEALFEAGAFDNVTGDQARDVLAVVGEYNAAIGSRNRGGVRFWEGKDGDLEYAIDVPATDRGRALRETMDVADTYGRPVLDVGASTFTREGALARYTDARIRALTIGPTDASLGWDALTEVAEPASELAAKAAALAGIAKRRAAVSVSIDKLSRRARLWL